MVDPVVSAYGDPRNCGQRDGQRNFRIFADCSVSALTPLSDEVIRPEVWGAERDGAFPARSTPGRDGLFGKGEDFPTFGVLDGPLPIAIAQRFVPGCS